MQESTEAALLANDVAANAASDQASVPENEGPTPADPGDEPVTESVTGDATAEGAVPDGEAPDGDEDQEPAPRLGPGAELSDDEIVRRLAALLFASPEPLSLGKLVEFLKRPERPRVRAALEELQRRFEGADLPIQVRGIRGGHTLMTTPDVAETLSAMVRGKTIERVSPAALETLSVIAYRQPVTKAEVEAIRGVQAGPVLRSLVDRGLVKVVGRADVPGHPLQYGTTQEFLDRFGLRGLDELPRDSELARG